MLVNFIWAQRPFGYCIIVATELGFLHSIIQLEIIAVVPS